MIDNTELPIKNFDWGEYDFSGRKIDVLDTTLRDGLQDSGIRHPNLEEKKELVEKLIAVGVDAIDLAIPVARGSILKDAIELGRNIPERITIACLARTHETDIKAALELMHGIGRPIEGIIFVGSSPLRRYVQKWELPYMIRWMEENVSFAAKEGLIPIVATEHTTETEPDVLKQLYRVGLDNGGKKVCIADTTGRANDIMTRRIVRFFQEEVVAGYGNIPIDWHGHNDRDYATANSLIAVDAGANRVHTSVLKIGERAGNSSIEAVLTNLLMAGDPKRQDLTGIPDLAEYASKIFRVAIPSNYPGIGSKVFTTASGIHANAMEEAEKMGIEPGAPYSSVDPRWFGRKSSVVVGPVSGESNVRMVARRLLIPVTDKLTQRALNFAVAQRKILSDENILNIARSGEENSNGHS